MFKFEVLMEVTGTISWHRSSIFQTIQSIYTSAFCIC